MSTINDFNIKNIKIYNTNMKKSVNDKLWFMNYINQDAYNFVDYGCADGSLMKEIYSYNYDYNYFGFDINEDMINLAKGNFAPCDYYSDWNNLMKDISYKSNYKNSILNLSSLIHEVYSYGNETTVNQFWRNVFESYPFEYIVIRDMALSKSSLHIANTNDVAKIHHFADHRYLNDFEGQWGSIDYLPNMVHWLLKYKYETNWEREVKENYLPITIEELFKIIPQDKYRIVYSNHYTLPYIKDTINKDFNIELKENTHIKILLQRI